LLANNYRSTLKLLKTILKFFDKMEEVLLGRRTQWKKTSMEDNLHGRQPPWNTTSMEDDLY
jgi:hypothetical protein